jgi:AraC family transcriptional regulator of adaptative response / DNA-3-methyladenine glycosylase II
MTTENDDALYLALKARDARFDGKFFTAVTSTGIYCRPVCRVRTPKRENCRFFDLAAQAEAHGFRPCLRCRPELAPGGADGGGTPWSGQDASAILARHALHLLDTQVHAHTTAPTMTALALRLGISDRHLRRIFETHWGLSPLQYLQTRRLLCAKQLLTDTRLPVTQVAALSGFSSVRRFNTVFASQYHMQPRALRAAKATAPTHDAAQGILIKAAYRPPLDHTHLLSFYATRSVDAMERIDTAPLHYARTLRMELKGKGLPGWVDAHFQPGSNSVHFRVSPTLAPVLPQVIARLRAWLDLDADPGAIDEVLDSSFAGCAGMRVPGTPDGFELAVRAVLGQQITVQAARTITKRLVARFGTPVETPWSEVNRCFPDAATLANANPQDLGEIGIVRQRQQAILALSRAVRSGTLDLQPGGDVSATLRALQELPGIGAWTAHYIAMRALRWPDAFPAGDVALHKALGVQGSPKPAQAAELASQAWRPWRSYAVIRAWHSLSNQ